MTADEKKLEESVSLDAGRLNLSGDANWDLARYLEDVLWLPFVEPAILLHHGPVTWAGPPLVREDYSENLKLAKIWDSRGLLALFHEEHPTKLRCQVFNAYKNLTTDRQIGD